MYDAEKEVAGRTWNTEVWDGALVHSVGTAGIKYYVEVDETRDLGDHPLGSQAYRHDCVSLIYDELRRITLIPLEDYEIYLTIDSKFYSKVMPAGKVIIGIPIGNHDNNPSIWNRQNRDQRSTRNASIMTNRTVYDKLSLIDEWPCDAGLRYCDVLEAVWFTAQLVNGTITREVGFIRYRGVAYVMPENSEYLDYRFFGLPWYDEFLRYYHRRSPDLDLVPFSVYYKYHSKLNLHRRDFDVGWFWKMLIRIFD